MKQPKKLTLEQKRTLSKNHLDWHDWMFVSDLGAYLKIIHKTTNKIKIINK
jgi:hypothetical protein